MTWSRAWLRSGVVAGTAAAACQFTHGKSPTDAGTQIDAPLPDGPTLCASTFQQCAGSAALIECVAGSSSTTIGCSWGCKPGSPDHCGVIQPTGGAVTGSDLDPAGLGSANLTGVVVDTDAGTIGGSAANHRLAGSVMIFRFSSLTVSGPVTFTGSNAVAFVSSGDIDVASGGVIDARGCPTGPGASTSAGPGGFTGGAKHVSPTSGSGAGGGGGAGNNIGGGGGGFGGTGGDGDQASGANGTGGAAFGSASITPLVGGGGGGGGGGGTNSGSGGGGGGAVQLVANGNLSIEGGINAGGCGGSKGTGGSDGGGGGGAGGAILLEALGITISGSLAVNGGGAGGGNSNSAGNGAAGSLDRNRANGGNNGGGDGAAGSNADGASGQGNGGGGGGAIGWIRINTQSGSATVADPTKLSPNLQDSGSTCTTGVAVGQ